MPNCPEVSRDQWQKENDTTKTPRENTANYWFNCQIYRTESVEEEDQNEKENEDDVTTDELGRTARKTIKKEGTRVLSPLHSSNIRGCQILSPACTDNQSQKYYSATLYYAILYSTKKTTENNMPCNYHCELRQLNCQLILIKEDKISTLQQTLGVIDEIGRQAPHRRDEVAARRAEVTNKLVEAQAEIASLTDEIARGCNPCNVE